ncbi:hypothetical protein CspeluHIS016_0701340 [Cutaneotrichosporon spelunceum]|uniref:Uncharacterized protein n=1 Tax=Cutaneotrichosporon spelunceum TaxID=1672016 RepID=A0AAD3TYZ1_9TREE|nr:hypothetical protein CspeluHIS016_0701340 [Cutaneotrichosporon spelunceum]
MRKLTWLDLPTSFLECLEANLLREILDDSVDSALSPGDGYDKTDVLLRTPAGKRLPVGREWLNEYDLPGHGRTKADFDRLQVLLHNMVQCGIFGEPSRCFGVEDVFVLGTPLPLLRFVDAQLTRVPANAGIYFTRRCDTNKPVATVACAPCATKHVVNVSFDAHHNDLAHGSFDFHLFLDNPPADLTVNFQKDCCKRWNCHPVEERHDRWLEDAMEETRRVAPLGVLTSLVSVLRDHPSTRVTLIGVESLRPHTIPALALKHEKTIPKGSFAALIDLLKGTANRGNEHRLSVLRSDEYRERVGAKMFELETVCPKRVYE